MIQLPKESIEFFENNYKQIFSSGELAEGKWNSAVADWTCEFTGAAHSLAVNSNGGQAPRDYRDCALARSRR